MGKTDEKQRKWQERNRLVLAVFASACGGFLLAIFFSAVPDAALKSDEWVAVAISAIAAAISGYAVYLVAQTLNTTQETLNVTREMSEIQTRPWVYYDSSEVRVDLNGECEVLVRLRNYGQTPAQHVQTDCKMIQFLPPEYFECPSISANLRHLPPGSALTTSTANNVLLSKCVALIHLRWSYNINNSKGDSGDIILILRDEDLKIVAEPLNIFDYKFLDEKFNFDSMYWINSRIYPNEDRRPAT